MGTAKRTGIQDMTLIEAANESHDDEPGRVYARGLGDYIVSDADEYATAAAVSIAHRCGLDPLTQSIICAELRRAYLTGTAQGIAACRAL